MALVPRNVFRNWWDDIDRFHRDIDEHFRQLSLRDDNLWRIPRISSFNDNVFRSWRSFESLDGQVYGSATVERDENKYQVIVDVQQFTPDEIIVRTDDKYNCITIEGKHAQRKDKYGYISRQFVRRYLLPRNYDIGYVKSTLSSDGILTITAPRSVLPAITNRASNERVVPIRRSYLPAIKAS